MSVIAPTPPPPPPAPPTAPFPPTPPQPPSARSGGRVAIQVGAVITGLLIIVAALNLFSLTAGRTTSNIHRTFGLTGQTLLIHAASADVSVLPSGTNEIEVDREARVPHGQDMPDPSISGDVLSLPGKCSGGTFGWLWFCSVHYVVRVPADLTLIVQTDSGDLQATGLEAGALTMKTGSGDLQLDDVTAPALTGTTGSGDVDASQIISDAAVLKTGSGDLSISFAQDPTTVQARTGSGDLNVSVPRDNTLYAVHGQTGSGDFNNSVRSLGDSQPVDGTTRSIVAQTGSGDLTIGYDG
jgi:hypothetical protein